MWVPWLIILACETRDPTETQPEPGVVNESLLPSAAIDLNMADGEMLRFGSVEGYRARRPDYTGDLAILVWADPLNKSVQDQARELAERPALVLVVEPNPNPAPTISYIEGLPGIMRIEQTTIEASNP